MLEQVLELVFGMVFGSVLGLTLETVIELPLVSVPEPALVLQKELALEPLQSVAIPGLRPKAG